MKCACLMLMAAAAAWTADLPVARVVLYKSGVAFYERSGPAKAGEPARLDFKAGDMDDVLKSLVVEARGGGVARVRYELSEPAGKRLADAGVEFPEQVSLATLLNQWRGARISVLPAGRTAPLRGVIAGARLALGEDQAQRQELTLFTDGGILHAINLDAAGEVQLEDARLQQQLAAALGILGQSRSRERRAVFIDLTGAPQQVVARYMAPAPVWKSSYRLNLEEAGMATLEGWAIVDNATGEDWTNVDLTVVSGRPVSFISRLYEPRYLSRPEASLPEERAAAPILHESAQRVQEQIPGVAGREMVRAGRGELAFSAPTAVPLMAGRPDAVSSTIEPAAEGAEIGELFEYRFSQPVTARRGESLLLPFLQQKIAARRLLVWNPASGAHPRSAAEVANGTGQTLDGGPVTVYQGGGYAGEALMETLKTGDKRLLSFAADQGARVTTAFGSRRQLVRSLRAARGILTTRSALETITTYTATNADARAKELLIEHAVDPNRKLLKPQPAEKSGQHYRFALNLPARGEQKLEVAEEQLLEESVSILSLTPDILFQHAANKSLSAAARGALEAIAARKREAAAAEREAAAADREINELSRDQERLRQNLNSLNRVSGQQEQVQRYAAELAKQDAQIAALRDKAGEARRRKTRLDGEIAELIEKLEI
jgi:hypothetical protein